MDLSLVILNHLTLIGKQVLIDINNLGTIYKTLHTFNSLNLKTFLHQMYLNIFM